MTLRRFSSRIERLHTEFLAKSLQGVDFQVATGRNTAIKERMKWMWKPRSCSKKIGISKHQICVDIPEKLLHIIVHVAIKAETVEGCRIFREVLERYPSRDAFSAAFASRTAGVVQSAGCHARAWNPAVRNKSC
ncbi:MAG: hypothetical protein HQM12_05690 [SAR324 cluster bacterium]|nr:hypothetical protein [SAR324 cluster bacterium]